MPSMIVSVRRRLPMRLRTGGLRLLGRAPAVEPERIREFELALPVTPPRTLSIRAAAWCSVGRRLEETGLAGYEPDTLACFLAAIQESGSRPVFDVGANIGVFSWLASALTPATVVAFEPTPDLTVQMRSICTANALGVVVEEMALGAALGPRAPPLGLTDSSTGCEPASDRRTVLCPFRSRPWMATSVGPHSSAVLKIDTESTEPDVLRGAAELLAQERHGSSARSWPAALSPS
jgi:FkbM family methyltransferase